MTPAVSLPTGPDDAASVHARTGVLAGVAHSLWGVFPLDFHQIQEVLPAEVLIQAGSGVTTL